MTLRIFSIALLVVALCSSASADSFRFPVSVVCTDGEKSRELEPGRYLSEPDWLELDASIVERQNEVTRLTAENASLLDSKSGGDWRLVLAGTIVGMAVGAYALSRWDE